VFGGAGGQHACGVARRLGIETVVFHPLAGVLSAYGIGLSDVTFHGEREVRGVRVRPSTPTSLEPLFAELEAEGRREIGAQAADGTLRVVRRVDLRYVGTETVLTLPMASFEELAATFDAEQHREFGHDRPDHPIELLAVRVEVGRHRELPKSFEARVGGELGAPREYTRLYFGDAWLERVPVYEREALPAGCSLNGPALVTEPTGSIVIEPGFSLDVEQNGLLLLRAREALVPRVEASTSDRPDPITLEIMSHAFMAIAEQMGQVLRRTALSTNIRERLDFSCAMFDRQGGLVANAPHIPVHLGAMSESVQAVLREHPDLEPGDVYVTNDPARGGSHLPDVTVVAPVHDDDGVLRFFVASRGHHADIGGITPGSMPAFSRTLAEEGVVLSGERLVHRGKLDRDGLLTRLASARFPARRPLENLADLEAQVAAVHVGGELLRRLCRENGLELVERYMQFVQDDAASRVLEAIQKIGLGEHVFEDALDDGTPIRVRLTVEPARLVIDFSGSGPALSGNLNAPRAVTLAAVLYFLRALVGHSIPLNGGCLRHVELHVPEGSVLHPPSLCAVAGGNVETSQRVVDVLLGAARALAGSQGTMNNLTFGDDTFGYYETICGGAGAGPDFDGASAVHTHMTNTRITDPEILERRFPVRLLEFSVRRGTGGAGRRRGGDGVVREFQFLRPLDVALLSERRDRAPFGLEGGAPGAKGRAFLNGAPMPGKFAVRVDAGARLRIETPGGGGFGAP
jgi:5-oxoprolinase (ATP-hydrolysing)